jgi:pimeloyl-[acyl-carrier protein] synthase
MRAVVPPDIDRHLRDQAFFADPYPSYDRLRQEAPVAWSETEQAWLLTRYADVVTTVQDPRHFSSRGRMLATLEHLSAPERARLKQFEDHFSVGLLNSDPPDHTRIRALVNKAFTPRVVEQLRPRVQALADELLDAVQAVGEMNVVRDLAQPLPVTVISGLLGVPPEDRRQFKVWADSILSFQGAGVLPAGFLELSQESLVAMRGYFSGLIEERRRHPHDDLLGRLVEAEMGGDRLTEAELMTTSVTLLIAGYETTTTLITNGLYTLLRHPDQLQSLRDDPALMPAAIEELLRFESPLQRNPRRVAGDMEYAGQRMRAGELVLQMLGSANRDQAVFPDPDRLDITRQPNRHVAFGQGIHFCLGAPLARAEAQIAIGTVLRRMPHLRLNTDAIAWASHPLLRAMPSLPVAF